MDPNLQSSQRIKRDLALISSALLYSHRWHAGESVRSIDSRTKSVDRVGSFGLDKFYVLLCTSMWSHVTFSIRSTVVLQWFYPSCSVHTITVTSEHCRAQWGWRRWRNLLDFVSYNYKHGHLQSPGSAHSIKIWRNWPLLRTSYVRTCRSPPYGSQSHSSSPTKQSRLIRPHGYNSSHRSHV